MARIRLRFERGERRASVGDTEITACSQTMVVDLPFGHLAWNRPSSLRVQHGGTTRVVPIVDLTRLAQLAICASAFAALIGAVAAGRRARLP
jgi:hypothetical protein